MCIAGWISKWNAFMRKYWREIGYYACVMLALGVIAWGAEAYRIRRNVAEEMPVAVSAEYVEKQQEEPIFALPEGMTVLNAFSAAPVWNAGQLCWQAHTAVDFACAEDRVLSLGGGTVKTLGESGIYGGFVEVACGERVLRYCSVAPDESLEVGMELAAGDLIGRADTSMPGEMQLGAHLHLEMCEDEKMEDITLYFEDDGANN